jgi:fibrillarin-like pre-rRNA processing protein
MKIKESGISGVFTLDIPTESRVWLATINHTPGESVYNEKLYNKSGIEYRTWDSYKSKLAACIQEGMKEIPPLEDCRILYLGASTGTTVSHVSDIVSNGSGRIIALEFSVKAARRLIQLSNNRSNIIPLVSDARKPEEYATSVGTVDFIFQDISQVNQSQIFIDNAKAFLKKNAKGLFIVKCASIDSTRPADEVTNDQIRQLEAAGFTIERVLDISKYEKEHRAILVKN